jgi:DNA-binding NtrC family response regulator
VKGPPHSRTEADTTVLLVDDEPQLLAVLKKMVPSSFRIITATDVASARSQIEDEDVGVIVCDHVLPDGKGLDWLTELRQRHHPAVAILITGYSEERLAIDATNSGGVFRYLKKPFTAAALQQTLQDAVRQHRRNREQAEAVRHQSHAAHQSPRLTRTGICIHYTAMAATAIGIFFLVTLFLGIVTLMILYLLKTGLGIDLFKDVHFRDLLP